MYVCMYIYIYIYIYTCVYMWEESLEPREQTRIRPPPGARSRAFGPKYSGLLVLLYYYHMTITIIIVIITILLLIMIIAMSITSIYS